MSKSNHIVSFTPSPRTSPRHAIAAMKQAKVITMDPKEQLKATLCSRGSIKMDKLMSRRVTLGII